MTHLSDLSYIQRGVSSAWFICWVVIYVYRWDRFDALRLRRLLRFELRSVITALVLVAMTLQLAYDVGSARLKYTEGFWVNPRTKEIQSKPAQTWSDANTRHIEPLYYTLACSLAAQNSVFFLLQSFWSYISKSVTKTTFMTSLEFRINIVCSCFIIALFPTVQYLFRNDFVYREAIPQVIFSIMTFTTGVLGIRTHFRLVSLIKSANDGTNETTAHVLQKLEYFKDMNLVLTFGFFGVSLPLGVMSVDALTPSPVISTNKFASDVLITNVNFFEFIMWVTLIMIFYPRKTGPGAPFSSARISKDPRLPRFNEIRPQDADYHYLEEPMRGVSVESNRPRSREMQTPVPTTANHQRNLSSESRQATLVPGITHPPPAVLVHNAGQANDSNNSSNRNSSRNSNGNNNKPEIVTTTIYYHDALMKAQQQQLSPRVQEQTNDELLTSTTIYYQDGLMKQQQQQQQHLRVQEQPSNDPLTSTTIYYHDGLMKAQQQQQRQQREREREQTNDDLLRSIESVSSSTTQCASVPQRTFSQSSSYSTTPGHKRSASQASTRALIPTSSRHNRANRSVDYPRPSRDYPSFRQEAAYMPDMPEVQRPFSSRSNYENRHHRQHSQSQSAINDSSNWAPSDMMQERSSIESDREMIQIAYVRNVAENEPTYNDSKFYEDLGRAHSVNTAAPGPRPFSPFSQLNHY